MCSLVEGAAVLDPVDRSTANERFFLLATLLSLLLQALPVNNARCWAFLVTARSACLGTNLSALASFVTFQKVKFWACQFSVTYTMQRFFFGVHDWCWTLFHDAMFVFSVNSADWVWALQWWRRCCNVVCHFYDNRDPILVCMYVYIYIYIYIYISLFYPCHSLSPSYYMISSQAAKNTRNVKFNHFVRCHCS